MELALKNLSVEVDGRQLFHVENSQVSKGNKIGFVAVNGSGKTTLLKLILSSNPAIIKHASIGYLPQQTREIGASGGEKVRLTLAKVLLGDHQLLLLDEPTNFLDIAALAALETFLKDYPGTFVLVSHDQTLIARCTTQTWTIKQGLMTTKMAPSEDDLQAHLRLLEFQKDQLIQDPDADLNAIQKINQQIMALRK
ncbi:ATP-binding cassette domain-containing protein [Lapidilactobacillus mulanensis]|uniref:ATP-binding cassette domain-containing protein n=1 Tax=Lapidilactobacillus mulanensis TaxID=2485999 RepID=A0ABW4DM01_9LACO|nr:ATP-binding cassette domain-containing protein [Lapidilactobacillus mulanensis]